MPNNHPERWVDLQDFLDGTYEPVRPEIGALRDDNQHLLYPGKWHSLSGPTESGKTWKLLGHARDELYKGNYVAYLHFEESNPASTVARLRAMGVKPDVIGERFAWLDALGNEWVDGDLTCEFECMPTYPTLVIVDGRNAACDMHDKDIERTPSVTWFHRTFVQPAVRVNAAFIHAAHPVKAKDRQNERHDYGSTAWLDMLDGVAFRLLPSKSPIVRGQSGFANLHVVKDREGEVRRLGRPTDKEGWTYMGNLVVDNSEEGIARVRISAPSLEVAPVVDTNDELIDAITHELSGRDGQRYPSENVLRTWLRAANVKFRNDEVTVALEVMEQRRLLDRGGYVHNRARSGRLIPKIND